MPDFNAWEIARIDLDQRIPGASGVWYIVDQGGMTAKPSSVSRWYCSWSRLSSLAPHSLASRGALSGPKAKSATATGWDMALYVLMVLLALVVIYLFYAVIHPERF